MILTLLCFRLAYPGYNNERKYRVHNFIWLIINANSHHLIKILSLDPLHPRTTGLKKIKSFMNNNSVEVTEHPSQIICLTTEFVNLLILKRLQGVKKNFWQNHLGLRQSSTLIGERFYESKKENMEIMKSENFFFISTAGKISIVLFSLPAQFQRFIWKPGSFVSFLKPFRRGFSTFGK